MRTYVKNKILTLDEIIDKAKALKKEGKVVVQSHGVFDLIHPGIIKHLNHAKKLGDVLIVSVIKDKDVHRGPGRPIFPEAFRAENVASLEQVDYVCLVDNEMPFECIKMIQPDIFAKGQAAHEKDRKIHERLFKEEKEFYSDKCRIIETEGFSLSSSHIINNFLDIYPEETKKFLSDFKKKYSFSDIADRINALKDLKVMVIGDGIIDEYHYCEPLGKSSKANLVVNKYLSHEVFAGGTFAVANHIAGLCDNINLVSLLGREDSREEFIAKNLKPNVKTKFFYRDDGPSVIKKRYIHEYLNQKLFEVCYMNDDFISGELERDIIDYLVSEVPQYDMIMVSNFGHGFITDNIIEAIKTHAKKIAVNAQTNAANVGYNLITRYDDPDYVCLDESELRLSAQEKHADIEQVAKKIANDIKADCLIVTLGKKGSFGVNHNSFNRTPIFSHKVVDTVGAGDAFFAYTAPCYAKRVPLDMLSFIGNAVGAIAVQIVCNKKSVEKFELLEFINTILK
ncbi:MAG: adenylyltransferase/cytidyltransferase family protein [Deltaproteobacteria bacterium]|nr:adenylyltransferase/cytidyltransferase family protein [Deltaproteobacteria bacterium]